MNTPTEQLDYAQVEERHTYMVGHLAKAGSQIHDSLTGKKKAIWLTCCFVFEAVSNLLDQVKKHVAYNKDNKDDIELSMIQAKKSEESFFKVIRGEFGFDYSFPMDDQQCHALHMATGIAGEGGEILSCIIKSIATKSDVDLVNLDEEIGDLEFYLEGLRHAYGISRKTTLENNYTKLMTKRYPNGFSNEAAIARADKEPDNHPELTGMAKIDGEIVETYDVNKHNSEINSQSSDPLN